MYVCMNARVKACMDVMSWDNFPMAPTVRGIQIQKMTFGPEQ